MTKILVRLLLFVVVVLILKELAFLLVPLAVAGIIAILIQPISLKIERRFGLGKAAAGIIVVLALTALIILLSLIIGAQIAQIIAAAPQYSANLALKLQGISIYVNDHLPKFVKESMAANKDPQATAQRIVQGSVAVLGSVIGTSASFLSVALVFPFYVFFILLYREYLVKFLFKLFRNAPRERLTGIVMGVYNVVHHYIRGLVTVMIIVGTLNSLGLWAIGIPSPFFFGFFAALLTIVPYVGVFIGSLIPITVAFVTKDSLFYPVITMMLFVVVQFLEGNFITPNITGSSVSLNPFAGIVSLVVFGWLWGMPGVIIAYPMTAIAKVIFDKIPELNAWGYLLSDFNALDKKDDVEPDGSESDKKSKPKAVS